MQGIDYTGDARAKKTTEIGKANQRLTEEKPTHILRGFPEYISDKLQTQPSPLFYWHKVACRSLLGCFVFLRCLL